MINLLWHSDDLKLGWNLGNVTNVWTSISERNLYIRYLIRTLFEPAIISEAYLEELWTIYDTLIRKLGWNLNFHHTYISLEPERTLNLQELSWYLLISKSYDQFTMALWWFEVRLKFGKCNKCLNVNFRTKSIH